MKDSSLYKTRFVLASSQNHLWAANWLLDFCPVVFAIAATAEFESVIESINATSNRACLVLLLEWCGSMIR